METRKRSRAKRFFPSSREELFSWFVRNWFMLGLVVSVLLASLFPEPGASGGVLHTELTTRIGIVVIFLLQGLTLPMSALVAGATNVRLHLLIQLFTFVILPLLGIVTDATLGSLLPPDLRQGLLYLCVLPSTIKTAVVFTSLAGGDAAAAVFSATLSSLIGVVATPLWIGFLARESGTTADLGPIVLEVVQLLIVPFFAGILLRRLFLRFADALKGATNHLASGIVLFVVYAAFCNSILEGTWQRHSWTISLLAFAIAAFVFALATGLSLLASRFVGLGRADTITVIFCAPQKTLASGAPLAKLIFTGSADLGLILLPLLFYHPLQLLAGGVLVSYLARPARSEAPSNG